MLPGEMVTTFKPCVAGTLEGASSVCCAETGADGGGVNCVPPTGALAGPVPDAGPMFEGQLPLEPTLRTGRGGTLGIGLFWSVIDSLSASYVRGSPPR